MALQPSPSFRFYHVSQRRISIGLLAIALLCMLNGLPGLTNGIQAADTSNNNPLQGSVIKTDELQNNPTINPNDVKKVPKGTEIDMLLSTSLSTDEATLDGQEFFTKVNRDVLVDGKVVIPRDTLLHGVVKEKVAPKRAGRNGYMTTRFDYMITPDGREVQLDGTYTTRDSGGKAMAKVVGRGAGFTLAGGAIGALMVLKYGGLAAVAASNGYALAGGAAVGGTIGLASALATKGKNQLIQPGAQLKLKLEEDLDLPTMNMPDESANNLAVDGLSIKILGLRIDKDPFGEPNEMTLTLDIDNRTGNSISFFDVNLEDEQGSVFSASPFGDTGLWFQKIEPNSHLSGNLSFNVDNPKLRHNLVIYKAFSREPMVRIALLDDMKTDKKTAKTRLKEQQQQSASR